MKARQVVVTGAPEYLARRRHLFEALARRFHSLELQPERPPSLVRRAIFKARELADGRVPSPLLRACDRWAITHLQDGRCFRRRSQMAERRLLARTPPPDLVIHFQGMFSPFWGRVAIPYVMMLDYTMALVLQNYPPRAPFADERARQAWLTCEARAYAGASHLFACGPQTAASLVKDYGIEPQRVSVVGSSGHFAEPFDGTREFGTKRVLFNGSDFHLKGGDRMLAAFRLLRQRMPEARLVVVGKALGLAGDGVENPGYVTSPEEMRRWFLQADLVVAPARCDPYPRFLIEAMNYGVPCVTSAVDGMPDIVTHQRSGLVLEKCEPTELSEALASLLSSPDRLRQMSAFARARVKQDLNWETIATRVTGTLERL
jgi:glycogen(starch) synthase